MNNHDEYKDGYTLELAQQEYTKENFPRYAHSLNDISEESKEALSYIKSFNNGLFIPDTTGMLLFCGNEIQLSYTKYLNGYATNESGKICKDHVHRSTAIFSDEDARTLPDLTTAMRSIVTDFEEGKIIPPHITGQDNLQQDHGIFGWYAKTEQGIVGIIKINWHYYSDYYIPDFAEYYDDRYFAEYYDDKYFIVRTEEEEYSPIDRDSLLDMFGKYETTFIYDGKYDENGKSSAHGA